MSKKIIWHTAPWCQPCKQLKPVAKKIASRADAEFHEIDVSVQEPLIPEITGVPTAVITSGSGEILQVLAPNFINADSLRKALLDD